MMIKSKRTSMIGGALALLVLVACDAPVDKAAVAQEAAPPATSTAPLREPDVIYVPTPQPVVDAMLEDALEQPIPLRQPGN